MLKLYLEKYCIHRILDIKINHILLSKTRPPFNWRFWVLQHRASRCRISPSYSNNPNTLAEVSWIPGIPFDAGIFTPTGARLNGFIMTACAPRLCCLSISPLSVFGSSRWFRAKRQRRHSRPLFFLPFAFFRNFQV